MDVEKILNTKNPWDIMRAWLAEAEKSAAMSYPNAMCISTVDNQGRPSSRVVLLKEITDEGLVFFSNYKSRKGQEIEKNPYVAANFYWDKFFRQMKIIGKIKKIKREDSVKYWQSRPRESQLSQFVSQQSQPVESRDIMNSLYQNAEKQWQNKEIPCPEHWGGYLIQPEEIEFWMGREFRFHDRVQFKKQGSQSWLAQRLFP